MNMRRFAFNVVSDTVIFGCFYLWQIQHIEAAHAFLSFVLWTFAVLLVIGVFAAKPSAKPLRFSMTASTGYVITGVQIGLMVWTGMTALAVTYFLAWVLILSQTTQTKEAA
jgi:hypothetical protein